MGAEFFTNNIKAYNGTNWHNVKLDGQTRSLSSIDYQHYEIHEGNAYYVEYEMLDLGFQDGVEYAKKRSNVSYTPQRSKVSVNMVAAVGIFSNRINPA